MMKAVTLTKPWRPLASGLLVGSAIVLAGIYAQFAEADENLQRPAASGHSVLDKNQTDEALAYKLLLHSGLHAAQVPVEAERQP